MRDLRFAVGSTRADLKSQTAFAKFLGISRSLLDKIERRVHDCTVDLANTACLSTGALPTSLAGKGTRPLLDMTRKPYTPEAYREFRVLLASGSEADAERLAGQLSEMIQAMFIAAARKGQLFPLAFRWDLFMESSLDDLNLRKKVYEVLGEHVTKSVADYEDIEAFVRDTGVDKDPNIGDLDARLLAIAKAGIDLTDTITVETTYTPAWHPLLSAGQFGRGFVYWHGGRNGVVVFKQGKKTAKWPFSTYGLQVLSPNGPKA